MNQRVLACSISPLRVDGRPGHRRAQALRSARVALSRPSGNLPGGPNQESRSHVLSRRSARCAHRCRCAGQLRRVRLLGQQQLGESDRPRQPRWQRSESELPAGHAPISAPAVAVDGYSCIYWTNGTISGGDIERANLDGSEVIPNFVPGAQAVRGLTVAGSFIYGLPGPAWDGPTSTEAEQKTASPAMEKERTRSRSGATGSTGTKRTSATSPVPTCRVKTSKKKSMKANPGTESAAGPDGIYFTNGNSRDPLPELRRKSPDRRRSADSRGLWPGGLGQLPLLGRRDHRPGEPQRR